MDRMRDLSGLEVAVAAMFGVYLKNQGENGKLSKGNFLKLLKEELPSFDQGKHGDEIFKGVDLNQDGFVDFQEFALLVAMYAHGNFEALQAVMKEMEKKKSA